MVRTLRTGALDACLLTTIERRSGQRVAVWESTMLAPARLDPQPTLSQRERGIGSVQSAIARHIFPFQRSQLPRLRIYLCEHEERADYGDEYESVYARRLCGGDTHMSRTPL